MLGASTDAMTEPSSDAELLHAWRSADAEAGNELVRRHFPDLKIMARARNRQHALRLMDIGVRYFIRETYLSSLDLAQHTLEALGLTRADAVESIRRFDAHDKKQLKVQREIRDDEQKLIQSAQQAARELEQLFESDAEPTQAEKRRAEAS